MAASKALIVVDMQEDFITGSLGTREAQAIVEPVARRVHEAQADPDTVVILTLDIHCDDYFDTQEGRKLPVRHCVKCGGDSFAGCGWRSPKPIEDAAGSAAVRHEKHTFGSLCLPPLLPPDVREIELIGVCTDICVVSNALILKAAFPEARVIVRASLCAGTTPQAHQKALDVMRSCQVDID